MADANILEALARKGKGGCLEKLVLYGRVRCAIKQPDILGSSVKVSDVGAFAILDVFAVKCLGDDYFGNNTGNLYFSRGSMVIFIDSLDWVGEIVKVYGNNKSGVKVRQQWGAKSMYDGITALAFGYSDGSFIIVPNLIVKLGEKEPDLNMTPMEDFVLKLRSEDIMEFPVTLDSIADYEGVAEYQEIGNEDVKDIKDTYFDDNEKIDVSQIKMNLTYHLEGQKESEILPDVEEDIESMNLSRKKFAEEMKRSVNKGWGADDSNESIAESIKNRFIDEILTRYSENISHSQVKGKVYANQFISEISGKPFEIDENFKMPSQGEINKSIETLTSLIQMSPAMLKSDVEDINLPMFKDDLLVATVIIGITTGIGVESLRGNYYSCNRVSSLSFKQWFYMLVNMPYMAGMWGSGLSVVDCDVIYFSYTRFFTEGTQMQLCADLRTDLVYLKTLEDACSKDSFILEKDLKANEASYPGRGRQYLMQNRFPCKKDLVEVLKLMCGKRVDLSEKEQYALENMKWYSKDKTNSLVERGLVNTVDDYIVLEKSLEKETMIYKELQKKGSMDTGITEEQVAKAVEEFEAQKGFQLEQLQRDGVKLCMKRAAVLSGCAGSGKTTVSDCFTLCLEENLPDYNIVYVTPTGKACRRLAEVVGGVVKTIHSQFGVGVYGEGYLTNVKKKYQSADSTGKTIYICDEMAMCNTDLLYEIVRSLADDDIIYFLGDCKQLPPIGLGNPFYLMMKLLPCVELGVSKRAAEGSQVNYNTTLINCMSDDTIQELYYDDKTFFARECTDAEIPRVIVDVWKKFMSGEMNGTQYNEDDIQVITGYATKEKSFSTVNLNGPIQKYLRAKDKLLFRYGETDFYRNDRLIHSKLNSYGTQRYIEIEENTFKAVVTLGIMNGEVGKLVGITRTDFCQIETFDEGDYESMSDVYSDVTEEEYADLLKVREQREDKIRDDANFRNENYYFVKVKVYDTDLKRDVIVLYPARAYQQTDMLVLGGEDLGNLDFAYALTCHKMQGSQNKVVICPFGSSCSPTFINRNMINTMFTRSQEVVCNIGVVKGIDSPITKGRQHASPMKTNCMLDLLCGE